MEIKEILSELQTPSDELPRHAIERAIEEREAITPELLSALEYTKNNLKEVYEGEEESYLPMHALYLLAKFREKQAYPLIVDLFDQTGETQVMAEEVTGDIITEDLCRVFASVYNGDLSRLQQLIENREVSVWTRGAAIDALVILVARDLLEREQVVRYFKELLSGKLKGEPNESDLWSMLVKACMNLGGDELKPEIERISEVVWVDEISVPPKVLEAAFQLSPEEALTRLRESSDYTLIDDPIADLEKSILFMNPQVFLQHSPFATAQQARVMEAMQVQEKLQTTSASSSGGDDRKLSANSPKKVKQKQQKQARKTNRSKSKKKKKKKKK
ncbi:hypothetical protein AY599_19435 [Leptolyngbya valderiana BDU 20041]|nr:hypothetical protein AY599_19435 [Leptolyngbya valderiana BDU 20041]